jgi:hypothetical protein
VDVLGEEDLQLLLVSGKSRGAELRDGMSRVRSGRSGGINNPETYYKLDLKVRTGGFTKSKHCLKECFDTSAAC